MVLCFETYVWYVQHM